MKPLVFCLIFALSACSRQDERQHQHDAGFVLPPRAPGQTLARYCNNPGALTYSYPKTPETPTPLAKNLEAKHGIEVYKGPPDKFGAHVIYFKSLEDGRHAQFLTLRRAYGKYTILDAIKRWSGKHEWKKYLRFVEGRACLSRHDRIGDLSDAELIRLAIAQSEWEGGPRVDGSLCQTKTKHSH